jgi:predicted transcriptional regulator
MMHYDALMTQRQRAPHREGRRTTLRVPDEVMHAADALARELGTTPNDALVRLAEEGMALNERRRAVERLARARRTAVAGVKGVDAGTFPTPDEMRAAMLSGRYGP